jgi:diguanylate cyclase (GGDEF)-like protein
MPALGSAGSVASSFLALQGAHALLTAGVFWAFQRRFGNPVLRYWTWGWIALAAQLVGLASVLTLAERVSPTSPRYTAVVAFTLVGGYLKVAWLVIGALALATHRQLAPERIRAIVLGATTIAVASALPFAGAADPLPRFLARQGTMALLAGIAQLTAGVALWVRATRVLGARTPRDAIPPGTPALGQRLVAAAFVALGGLTFVSLVERLGASITAEPLPILPAMTESQVLLNFTLSIGLVIWLLEGEQRRTLEAAQRAEHMAYHDPLTGLPNRLLLVDRLRILVAHARRTRQPFAVFFLDVDHFKAINDTHGHAAGDRLLQQIAARLTAQLREADTVARLGGDEFVVLTPDLRQSGDVIAVGEKLRDAVREPVLLDEGEVRVTVSIGVSVFPDDGDDADALLRRSDSALYEAKADGRDAVRMA